MKGAVSRQTFDLKKERAKPPLHSFYSGAKDFLKHRPRSLRCTEAESHQQIMSDTIIPGRLRSKLFRGDRRLEACLSDNASHITPGAVGDHVTKIQTALTLLGEPHIAASEITTKLTARPRRVRYWRGRKRASVHAYDSNKRWNHTNHSYIPGTRTPGADLQAHS
jgi:hypothetical protein